MSFHLQARQRIKKETEFVAMLQSAQKIKNDFFFILFENQPILQPVRHFHQR